MSLWRAYLWCRRRGYGVSSVLIVLLIVALCYAFIPHLIVPVVIAGILLLTVTTRTPKQE